MQFPSYIEKCLDNYPLEKIMIYIEKFLIDNGIPYNIIRDLDIIVKVKDENVISIFEKIIQNDNIVSGENVIIGYLTIHELETNTMINFTYYEDLF